MKAELLLDHTEGMLNLGADVSFGRLDQILHAERYAEEVAQGLHCKGSKKAAKAPAGGGKRQGRPPKSADSADTEQIGLAL